MTESLRDALEPLIARSEATGAKIDVQLALFHELLARPESAAEPVGVSDEPVDTRAYLREKYREELDEWWAEQVAEHNASVGVSDEAVALRVRLTDAIDAVEIGAGSDHYKHGRETMRDDAISAAQDALIDVAPLLGTRPQPTPCATSEQLMSDAIRDSLAFEDGMPRGHLLVQIANRAAHALVQKGAVRPLPTREQIARTLHQQRNGHVWLSSACLGHCSARYYAFADAVLALMGGTE